MHVLNAYKETVLYVITLKDLFYLGKVVLGTNIFTCGCEKTLVSLKFTVLCLPIASDKIFKKNKFAQRFDYLSSDVQSGNDFLKQNS